ncbi:DELTA-thalatoxin-Avl1b-like [Tachyglossus aculeatus]|uniref:DELTA-thalatoxin-Avl1b-like n=1 Tax=Tachyglossus aculeatus TaxID=9261 RepID=UPI0018F5B51F|nr:DELTA-thalatoxin-Avl1b-like [Tachyglossus aculeatus]
MAQTIEHLVHELDAGRCVGVEITNNTSKVFRSPRTYCYSGHTHTPPTPLIPPAAKGNCIFVKRNFSLRGSVGLLVYEIEDHTLAIMFSNPFNYNSYRVELAVALSSNKEETEDEKALFEQIYKGIEKTWLKVAKEKLCESQHSVLLVEGGIRVTATMSNNAKAIIRVHVECTDHQSSH